MERKTILVIEDDKQIMRFLSMALKSNDYEMLSAGNGVNGISMFLFHHPDLVLLDLGLPDIDGMVVLDEIRQASSTPVIIISARGKEQEKVSALDSGADDYLTKPFNIGELLARIRVAIRRADHLPQPPTRFVLRDLTVNFDSRIVYVGTSEVHLTPIEFNLLSLLIKYQGKVLTHSFIQKQVWGYESTDDYQSLRVFMASIRRKIEPEPSHPRLILTEVGVGYRLIDE
jgi:two-component system KDP operon response regulator KdpE